MPKLSTKHRRELMEVLKILNAIVSPMPVTSVKQDEWTPDEQLKQDKAVFERLSKSKPTRGKK